MPPGEGEAGVDLHVRAYLVDKLKLMHQRLAQALGSAGSAPPEGGSPPAEGLLDHLPFAVFTLDLEGRFLYGNRKAEQLSGYPRNELIGKGYYDTDLIRFRDLIKITALLGLSKRDPDARPFRLSAWKKDGSPVKLEVTVRLVSSGGTRQLLCVAREVRARIGSEVGPDAHPAVGRSTMPISICGTCKRVEDLDGDWLPLEYFLYKRLELEFTHDTCPDCMARHHRGEFTRSG